VIIYVFSSYICAIICQDHFKYKMREWWMWLPRETFEVADSSIIFTLNRIFRAHMRTYSYLWRSQRNRLQQQNNNNNNNRPLLTYYYHINIPFVKYVSALRSSRYILYYNTYSHTEKTHREQIDHRRCTDAVNGII